MLRSIFHCATLGLLLVLVDAPAAEANSKIGVASAVKNEVQGSGRTLSVGSSVFANERIRTGDASTAQLLFLDKTVVSVGPKAELLLDKYVYNPNRGTGQVVLNAVQGGMRFVTGAQNPTNYAIKTPVATLGIRGTVVDLLISPIETFIGVLEGTLTIRLLSGMEMTLPEGWYVKIAANGTPGKAERYKGDDPSIANTEFADHRMDLIDQLFAKQAQGYQEPPKRHEHCEYSECYPTYYNSFRARGR